MSVSRLRDIPGIGVDRVGDAADALADPEILRLENLDTDIPPPVVALQVTSEALHSDDANSYLPFQGHMELRQAACAYVGARDGATYDPTTQCVSVAGGLNGVLNALLATVEPGQQVVITDPSYAGLVNRIRLVGGIPRFVTAEPTPDGWRVDPEVLAAAIGPQTAAVLAMSPSMPTGGLMGVEHWDAMAARMRHHRPWIIYDAAMDRLRFDGQIQPSPASHPDLRDRVITVGSASKELRLIGWRVGWVLGPPEIMADIRLVGLTNVVCQVGIAQGAVAATLRAPDVEDDIAAAVQTLRGRRDEALRQLADYPCVRPEGGWSMLLETAAMGISPATASDRLMRVGLIAATPMDGWGPSGGRYLRLVFANEPVERLGELRSRFEAALS